MKMSRKKLVKLIRTIRRDAKAEHTRLARTIPKWDALIAKLIRER
jgi:hypothetical protein